MTTAILTTPPESHKPQQSANPQTYLEGRGLGTYDAYRNGQHITTLYANTYPEALTQFHTLLDELRTEQPTPTWWTCDCGRTVDVGSDCPDCHPQAILWITATGRRFLEPLAPAAPADCLEDQAILVNDAWWLTADLDATPDTFTSRKIEEAVL